MLCVLKGASFGCGRAAQSLARSRIPRMASSALKTLQQLGAEDSSTAKFLTAEVADIVDGSKAMPRTIKSAHYTVVLPESAPSPTLVALSKECALEIGLDPEEATNNPDFAKVFAGNVLMPNLDKPFATVYGCHSHGQWFGQLGDGRALSLGESHTVKHNSLGQPYLDIRELQLKGCGRTPFSRGFDGRAVLRSSIREFLVSEAMHHLGIPTTRALCLVATGQKLRRPWYMASTSWNPYKEVIDMEYDNSPIQHSQVKFPPDAMVVEQGAVLCRVANSFIRFGHLELFAKREEWANLIRLADFVCLRNYPHLLAIVSNQMSIPSASDIDPMLTLPSTLTAGPPRRYIELFRAATNAVAEMVAKWLSVGYTQGNMNSDNTLLSGCTMDYGPFGWMERYDPLYQPFTTDVQGNFAFSRQSSAMAVNVLVLAETVFVPLIRHLYGRDRHSPACEAMVTEIRAIAEEGYATQFAQAYSEVKRRKLGLQDAMMSDDQLYEDLLRLMDVSEADFTIFFRELGQIDITASSASLSEALQALSVAFYDPATSIPTEEWLEWLGRYKDRVMMEQQSPADRRKVMHAANPKYILRNWMSMLAYERAERQQDYSILHELAEVLKDPYGEQSPQTAEAWYKKTPPWARRLPGAEFMSCSS